MSDPRNVNLKGAGANNISLERTYTDSELQAALALFAEQVGEAIDASRDLIGRIMHESWSRTKLEQGFHKLDSRAPCQKCHADLVDWSELPQAQKDINLN